MKVQKKYCFLWLALLCLYVQAYAQDNRGVIYQTIRGTIVDKDLQTPLPFGTVYLTSDSVNVAVSDNNGNFKLDKVPVGRHYLKIVSFGYKNLVIPVLVVSGKELVLTIEMEEDVMELEEVTIQTQKEKGELNNSLISVSGNSLRTEEINRFAGSRQDPSRMASNYAGVAGGGDLRNDIIVRGNSPMGVLWRLEGVDIMNPNHFSFTGNTGGAFSMLNNNLLANSDFLTGAFPAEYGNKTAAVFDVRLRKGNNQKREHTFQIGMNGIEFGTEGPLNKKGASYLVNGRFLTFDLLNKLGVSVGANGIPQFKDGTVKIFVPTEKAGTFSLWAIGGTSKIYIKDPVLNDTSEYSATTDDFYSNTHVVGISNTHFLSKNTTAVLTLCMTGTKKGVVSTTIYKTQDELKDYDLINKEGHRLINYTVTHRFNSKHLIKSGLTYRSIYYNNNEYYYDKEDSVYRTTWDSKGQAGMVQGYVHWQYRLNEKLTLNNGLYYQRLMLNGTQSLEPRLAAIYQPNKRNKWSLATGLHSQAQDLFVYQAQFYDTINAAYYRTNRDLKFTKSIHVVAGYQRMLKENLRFKAEAYLQEIYNAPVDASSKKGAGTYSILNSGADFSFYSPDSLVNKGTGRNYGVELTLERYFSKNYYLLSNVSLLKSTYKGFDKIERNTAFDIGHVVNVLFGREFHLDAKNKRVLSVDFKMTHSGGRREIGIDSLASAQKGYGVYDYSETYTSRLKNYFRTDLKISYTVNRPSANHTLFVAADNLFNSKNVLTKAWDNDKKEVVTIYQMGIFPYLGYRVQF